MSKTSKTIMRPPEVGYVYRVTFNFSPPGAKRRILESIVGRLIEINDDSLTFRTNKRNTYTMPNCGIVDMRYVEEG